MKRRAWVAAAGSWATLGLGRDGTAHAQNPARLDQTGETTGTSAPANASQRTTAFTTDFAPVVAPNSAMLALAKQVANGAALRVGRVNLTVEPLVDNGNTVPVQISLDSPMTDDQHVVGMALFSEKNPESNMAEFVLSPASGLARVSTRVRLTGTGQLLGVAKLSDGSCWMQTVEVIVTLAACIED